MLLDLRTGNGGITAAGTYEELEAWEEELRGLQPQDDKDKATGVYPVFCAAAVP